MAASGKPLLSGYLIAHLKSCGTSASDLERMNMMLCNEIAHAERKIKSFSPNAVRGESDADLARRLQQDMEKESENQRKHDAMEHDRLLQQFLSTCQVCSKTSTQGTEVDQRLHIFAACDHRVCGKCADLRILPKGRSTNCQSDFVCPVGGCGRQLQQGDVKGMISAEEFEKYLDSELSGLDSATFGSNFRRCPAGCGWGMFLEDASPAPKDSKGGKRGLDGKELSAEAVKHRDRYRFRCRVCPDTEFCAMCNASPYHMGFTCEAFKVYQVTRKCRFCGGEVGSDSALLLKDEDRENKKKLHKVLHARNVESIPKGASIEVLVDLVAKTDAMANVCKEKDCVERAANCCQKVVACGHMCLGTKGEKECLGCLQCNSNGSCSAEDFCNICFVEGLQSAPCVRLKCGHVFHMHCIETKVKSGWVGARVTFGFLECPLCKEHMVAEQIEDIVKDGQELYKAIRTKAEQRLALEGSHKDAPELREGGRYHGQTVNYAMHKFAYYVCFKCKAPYFGGYRSCEVAAHEGEQNAFNASELVCGGCSAAGSTTCPKHGCEAIEHKCKFCCAVASWFCWGTTHFCDSCHRKQGTPESMSRKDKKLLPQCTPDTCPLKIPHPPNGDEFVLGCQICRSASFC